MNENIIAKIDELIEECTEKIANETIKLVNIKSTKGESEAGAPFGKGPKAVLDEFMRMAEDEGLYTEDYNVGVISAAMKKGSIDLGIWLHGDVVAEGDGWSFPPYDATEYKGCIIGRGVTDNKGQLVAIFNLFKIFKRLGVELDYNPAIFLGSDEESGMRDIIGIEDNPDAKGFINVCTPPKLSLVPDGSFPVGYGGKGGMTISLISKAALSGLSVLAGDSSSPGLATATFTRRVSLPDEIEECTVTKDELVTVSAQTPPRHTSNPDPEGNMITKLSRGLIASGALTKKERDMFEFFEEISLDINGRRLGICAESEYMKPTTVFAKSLKMRDGRVEFSLNIRYPVGITYDQIVERISEYAKTRGFEVSAKKAGVNPYVLDPDNGIVRVLYDCANEITGENKAPYTCSGGTYAHRLPNAYVYGMDGNLPPDDFPSGRGGAHGIDEAVSLFRLKRAMRVYARALLRLNDIRW